MLSLNLVFPTECFLGCFNAKWFLLLQNLHFCPYAGHVSFRFSCVLSQILVYLSLFTVFLLVTLFLHSVHVSHRFQLCSRSFTTSAPVWDLVWKLQHSFTPSTMRSRSTESCKSQKLQDFARLRSLVRYESMFSPCSGSLLLKIYRSYGSLVCPIKCWPNLAIIVSKSSCFPLKRSENRCKTINVSGPIAGKRNSPVWYSLFCSRSLVMLL